MWDTNLCALNSQVASIWLAEAAQTGYARAPIALRMVLQS